MSCKSKEGYPGNAPHPTPVPKTDCKMFEVEFGNSIAREIFDGDLRSKMQSLEVSKVKDVLNKFRSRGMDEKLKQTGCGSLKDIFDSPESRQVLKTYQSNFYANLSR
jgi:hypothetical protein